MIFKGGIVGFGVTFFAVIVFPKIGFWLPFGVTLLLGAKGMVEITRHSARDFDNARTLFGTVSAFFGWTHSHKVATGERPLNFGFLEGAVFGSFLGLMIPMLAQNLMAKGVA